MSKRGCPKRKVLSVTKTGSYGQVLWRHVLECGHVETRKRVAPADMIGCEACAQGLPPVGKLPAERVSEWQRIEQKARQTQMLVARRFGVPMGQVRVEMSRDMVSWVQVILFGGDLDGLAAEETEDSAASAAVEEAASPEAAFPAHSQADQRAEA